MTGDAMTVGESVWIVNPWSNLPSNQKHFIRHCLPKQTFLEFTEELGYDDDDQVSLDTVAAYYAETIRDEWIGNQPVSVIEAMTPSDWEKKEMEFRWIVESRLTRFTVVSESEWNDHVDDLNRVLDQAAANHFNFNFKSDMDEHFAYFYTRCCLVKGSTVSPEDQLCCYFGGIEVGLPDSESEPVVIAAQLEYLGVGCSSTGVPINDTSSGGDIRQVCRLLQIDRPSDQLNQIHPLELKNAFDTILSASKGYLWISSGMEINRHRAQMQRDIDFCYRKIVHHNIPWLRKIMGVKYKQMYQATKWRQLKIVPVHEWKMMADDLRSFLDDLRNGHYSSMLDIGYEMYTDARRLWYKLAYSCAIEISSDCRGIKIHWSDGIILNSSSSSSGGGGGVWTEVDSFSQMVNLDPALWKELEFHAREEMLKLTTPDHYKDGYMTYAYPPRGQAILCTL